MLFNSSTLLYSSISNLCILQGEGPDQTVPRFKTRKKCEWRESQIRVTLARLNGTRFFDNTSLLYFHATKLYNHEMNWSNQIPYSN